MPLKLADNASELAESPTCNAVAPDLKAAASEVESLLALTWARTKSLLASFKPLTNPSAIFLPLGASGVPAFWSDFTATSVASMTLPKNFVSNAFPSSRFDAEPASAACTLVPRPSAFTSSVHFDRVLHMRSTQVSGDTVVAPAVDESRKSDTVSNAEATNRRRLVVTVDLSVEGRVHALGMPVVSFASTWSRLKLAGF